MILTHFTSFLSFSLIIMNMQISEYVKKIICISYHELQDQCLCFSLVARFSDG